MCGKIYEKCAEHNGWNIKRRAGIPAEFFSNVLENCKCGITWTYEKHIDGSIGNIVENYVDAESNAAEHEKSDGGVQIVFSGFGKMIGRDQINADEDQKHMPDIRVKRERPITMRDARWFNKCHNAAEQVVCGHKSVDSVTQGTRLQKYCNDTQVHWYAAKLEGEYPPYVRIIAHIKVIEKLFIDFCQKKKESDTSQNSFMTAFRKIAEFPREENANGYTDKCK